MKPGTKQQAEIFDLGNTEAYARWRDGKLENAPKSAAEILVEISDISAPTPAETQEIARLCRICNMAVYACHQSCDDERIVRKKAHRLAGHMGLNRLEEHRSMTDDGMVAIEVVNHEVEGEGRAGFIPYTDKPISWHTDGYYNPTSKRIKAMVLHCVRPAKEGGVNQLFDPELAYIRLRDENPAYITAFSHRRAMSIPPFVENGVQTRAESSGPVFTWDRYTGDLHMRFTDRKRNISWRDNGVTREALEFLRKVLSEDEHVITYRMNAAEGLLCNNVLHNRAGFTDAAEPNQQESANEEQAKSSRLFLRARYLDRVDS